MSEYASRIALNNELFEVKQANAILKHTLSLKQLELDQCKEAAEASQTVQQTTNDTIDRVRTDLTNILSRLYLHPDQGLEDLSSKSLTEMSALAKSKLEVLDSQRAPHGESDLTSQNRELKNSFIRATAQNSQHIITIRDLRQAIASKTEETHKLETERLAAAQEVKELQEALVSARMAQDCTCLCVCGMRKASEEQVDAKSLCDSIEKLTDEKNHYKVLFEQLSHQRTKLQMELEISEERFVHSKAYKKLLADAKRIRHQLDQARTRNEELQRFKEETLARHESVKSAQHFESLLREAQAQLEELRRTQEETALAKDRALQQVKVLETELDFRKNSKDPKLEKLEADHLRMKTQLTHLKSTNLALEEQIENLQQQHFSAYEAVVSEQLPVDCEDLPLTQRLEEYRRQVRNLYKTLKDKDRQIAKMEEYNKRNKKMLSSEQATVQYLKAEHDITEKAYEEAMKKNEHLRTHLNELQEQNTLLQMKGLDQTRFKDLHAAEIAAFEDKLQAKDELLTAKQELVAKLEAELAQRESLATDTHTKVRDLESKLEQVSNARANELRAQEEYALAKTALQDKIRYTESLCIKHTTEAAQVRFLHTQTVAKLERVESAFLQQSELLAPHEQSNKELLKYRKMLRCVVCKNRLKEKILQQCLHAFCSHCIHKFILVNAKKCPVCYVQFTLDELRSLCW